MILFYTRPVDINPLHLNWLMWSDCLNQMLHYTVLTDEASNSSCWWTRWTWCIYWTSLSCAFYHRSRAYITYRSLFFIMIGWCNVYWWYDTRCATVVTFNLQEKSIFIIRFCIAYSCLLTNYVIGFITIVDQPYKNPRVTNK